MGPVERKACLGVVIPVYNEARTVDRLMERVLAQECVREVVAVDDGSTDGSSEKLLAWEDEDARIRAVPHPVNRGKGAAVRTALPRLTAPIVVIQDADLEYDPMEYGRMLKPIQERGIAAVYGSRYLAGRKGVGPRWHTAGNRLLTWISNLATGQVLTDEATCYKMVRREVLDRIELEEDGFGFCPELTAKIAKLGHRIAEVPISYRPRTRRAGKKIRFRDGAQALWCMMKYNLC